MSGPGREQAGPARRKPCYSGSTQRAGHRLVLILRKVVSAECPPAHFSPHSVPRRVGELAGAPEMKRSRCPQAGPGPYRSWRNVQQASLMLCSCRKLAPISNDWTFCWSMARWPL